ncbi:MAG TPA: regulatory protein RecX [Patescibacteria group bacterium]|nr:regulatory protein RecX [Patescibacteria group bacterium]
MQDSINIALRFLKFRPRTVFEIEKKLKTKRFKDKEIKKVISVLKKNKLLDDENFAKMWIRDRNLLKPTGWYLLKSELRKLGVAEKIIEEALSDQDEEKLARQALESKSRLKNVDFAKKAAFLQRRGFKTNVIYKILKNSQ